MSQKLVKTAGLTGLGWMDFNFSMVESLRVNLAERSYSLHFGSDLTTAVRAEVNALSLASRKVVVVTDRNVATRQADALRAMFGEVPTIVLDAGEETKSLREYGRGLDFLVEATEDFDEDDRHADGSRNGISGGLNGAEQHAEDVV